MSTDVYWAMRFVGSGAGDDITFLAYTSDHKYYEGTKAAPATGFQNGKYYHVSAPVTMTPSTSVVQPTVTGNYSFAERWYRCEINGDATISGESRGWYFDINNPATLTLDHANFYKSSTSSEAHCTIRPSSVTFNLQGDNTITMLGTDSYAISIESSNTTVTMTGNGTLSIICKDGGTKTNGGFWKATGLSIVAAAGHTLNLTTTTNSDGTYTHTWTVAPEN